MRGYHVRFFRLSHLILLLTISVIQNDYVQAQEIDESWNPVVNNKTTTDQQHSLNTTTTKNEDDDVTTTDTTNNTTNENPILSMTTNATRNIHTPVPTMASTSKLDGDDSKKPQHPNSLDKTEDEVPTDAPTSQAEQGDQNASDQIDIDSPHSDDDDHETDKNDESIHKPSNAAVDSNTIRVVLIVSILISAFALAIFSRLVCHKTNQIKRDRASKIQALIRIGGTVDDQYGGDDDVNHVILDKYFLNFDMDGSDVDGSKTGSLKSQLSTTSSSCQNENDNDVKNALDSSLSNYDMDDSDMDDSKTDTLRLQLSTSSPSSSSDSCSIGHKNNLENELMCGDNNISETSTSKVEIFTDDIDDHLEIEDDMEIGNV